MINSSRKTFIFVAVLLYALFALSFSNFTYVGTLDGTGPTNNTPYYAFIGPYGLAHDGTYLYVSDDMKNTIYQMSNNSVVKRIGSDGYSSGQFQSPKLLFIKDNHLFVADSSNNRIQLYTFSGALSGQYQMLDELSNTKITKPGGITYVDGKYLVTSTYDSTIMIFDGPTMRFESFFSKLGNFDDGFSSPSGIVYSNGLIFVSDSANNRIKVFSSNLTYLYPIGVGKDNILLSNPQGISVSGDTLYVADTGNHRIVLFSLDGFLIETLGSKGNGNMQFDRPMSVIENAGIIYVADYNHKVVKKFAYQSNMTESKVLLRISEAESNASFVRDISLAAKQVVNITFAPRADSYVQSAKDYYANKSFSLGYSSASQAITYAQEDAASFGGAISFDLRSRLSVMSDGIIRLKNLTYPQSYSPDFNAVENLIASINSKLAAGDYSGALWDYKSASDKVSEIDMKSSIPTPVVNQTSNNTNTSGDLAAEKIAVEIRIAQVSASFDTLKQRSKTYKQDAAYDDVSGSLAVAASQLSAGSTRQANATISQAANFIIGYSSALEQKIINIDNALKNISQTESQIAKIGQEGYVIHPDIAPAKAKIESAKALAYSSPKDSMAMAESAISDALSQTGKEFMILGGAGIVVALIALVVAGTVAFFVVRHFKGKKKGL